MILLKMQQQAQKFKDNIQKEDSDTFLSEKGSSEGE
jgi:hypothetical protein